MLKPRTPFTETPKDQKFLLQLPDAPEAITAICLRIEREIGNRLRDPSLTNLEVIVTVKEALGMPEQHDAGATLVIMNVIDETRARFGFLNVRALLQALQNRKSKLQETN